MMELFSLQILMNKGFGAKKVDEQTEIDLQQKIVDHRDCLLLLPVCLCHQ